MFGKHFVFVNDDSNAVIAANIVANSNKKLGEKLESISEKEIKSKDRVDISLEEYTQTKKRLETLERANREMHMLLHDIGIPVEVIGSVEHSSINVTHCDDICDFKRKYRIEFDVDASPDLMKWRYEY